MGEIGLDGRHTSLRRWAFGFLALGLLTLEPAMALDRALLVGVSHYPALTGKDLGGPVNDLQLMRRVLAEMTEPPEQLTVLSEAGAASGNLPTRANILRGLARLAQQGRPGDWVLVYFSGHGAQVPQAPRLPGVRAELDGLDEVFLPRDTQQWNPATQTVSGALRDKELGAALRRIQAKGVNVWVIFDTCHAADMLRRPQASAAAASAWRFVSPQELHIPMRLWAERLGRSWSGLVGAPARGVRATRATPATRPQPAGAPTAGQLVTFYSSQEGEGTLEELRPDPLDPQQMRRYGLFTYELARAAQGWRGTFADLAGRIELAYEQRPFPTPQFNGLLTVRPSVRADQERHALGAPTR